MEFNIDENELKKCVGKEEETIPDNLIKKYVDNFMNSPSGKKILEKLIKEYRETPRKIILERIHEGAKENDN